MPHVTLVVLCAVGIAAGLGWGCKPAPATPDTAPFAAAVDAYLASQSMDMKAGSFRRLEVKGETATATVSLSHAEGAAGVSVQWNFTFARKDRRWQVTSCRH